MLTSFVTPRAPSAGETEMIRGPLGNSGGTGGGVMAGNGPGESVTPSFICSPSEGGASLIMGGGSAAGGGSRGASELEGSTVAVITPENKSAFSEPQATRQSHAAVVDRLRTTCFLCTVPPFHQPRESGKPG